jgi:hypothetical protein
MELGQDAHMRMKAQRHFLKAQQLSASWWFDPTQRRDGLQNESGLRGGCGDSRRYVAHVIERAFAGQHQLHAALEAARFKQERFMLRVEGT